MRSEHGSQSPPSPGAHSSAIAPYTAAIIARLCATCTGHVQASRSLLHKRLAVRTLLPLLGSGQIEQLLPVDVLGADDAWVLTRPARFTGVCAAARAGCYISLDVGWRDESRTRRIGTVRGVRCGEFQD